MKYSISWLNELAGTNLTPKEMADLFTRYSFEVDGLSEGAEIPEGVVVGKILEVSKHPNAEKLSLTKVAIDTEGKNILDIVCGAKNIASGDVVPVATIGTVLPNGMTIKESLIRGEKSQGMLCAEDELGLGADHSGILHLPKESILGLPVSQVLKKQDAVIDLSILSSRGHDALCHAGMAREVAAMAGGVENGERKMENGERGMGNERIKKLEAGSLKLEGGRDISVMIEAKEKCMRYIGVHLSGIKNGPSPEWMQERLRACGMRPISVVVDVTNYVMLETGQPLHAFDFRRIATSDKQQETSEKKMSNIFVRNAKKGEKMTLLDESEIELCEDDLVIANDAEVLALAGVMGGKKSGTSEETTEVFLEGANFDPMSVRKTRVRHKLSTESAYRFERDIDPNMAEIGVARAVELLKELAGATVVSGTDVYPEPVLPWTIGLDLQRVEKLLGIAVPEEDVVAILESLGLSIQRNAERGTRNVGSDAIPNAELDSSGDPRSVIRVVIPTQRRDLHTQEDLIEEIGRLYGYDRIAPEAPTVSLQSAPTHTEKVFERNFKDALVSAGCDEILTYSFYKKETAGTFGFSEAMHFSLQNPMNPDQQLFRSNLVPNVLEKVKENLRYFDSVRVFEIGNVYTKGTDGVVKGKKMIVAFETGEEAYTALKGRVESVFAGVRISGVSFVEATDAPGYFHKTRTADVVCRGKKIGTIGEISPFILEKLKLKKRVALFEAERDALLGVTNARVTYAPLPKFPFVWRDMSLAVPKSVTAGETENAIRKSVGKTLKSIELFDVYEKDGEKSFAYRLAFGDDTRTLTKDEAETLFQKCLRDLEKLGVGLK